MDTTRELFGATHERGLVALGDGAVAVRVPEGIVLAWDADAVMSARNDASSGSWKPSTSPSRLAPLRPDGIVKPAAAERSAEARSRRTRGWRCSTRLGNDIEPTGADAPE